MNNGFSRRKATQSLIKFALKTIALFKIIIACSQLILIEPYSWIILNRTISTIGTYYGPPEQFDHSTNSTFWL